jgi:hypothetical protein
MRRLRTLWLLGSVPAVAAVLAAVGCTTPLDVSEWGLGPAPLRMRSPARDGSCCYEDSLTGGQVFTMYCSYCHNAPSLAERNFANFRNVAAHMRVRANLTGKEYAKLMEFLRRWNDVPPPHPPTEPPSPKRFVYSQPIAELRPKTPPAGAAGARPAQAQQEQPAESQPQAGPAPQALPPTQADSAQLAQPAAPLVQSDAAQPAAGQP